MGEGLRRAKAAAEATQATEEHLRFLRKLAEWDGVASPQDIGPQTTQAENSARQTCKRRGWVEFDRHYWRLTDAGRYVLSAVKVVQPTVKHRT